MWYGDIVTPESFDELWLKEVRCLWAHAKCLVRPKVGVVSLYIAFAQERCSLLVGDSIGGMLALRGREVPC